MPESAFNTVTDKALNLPIFQQLQNKRVILASSSPNRRDAMERMVGSIYRSGLKPEIVPSTFPEDLPHADYIGRCFEYPIATAKEKGIEVFERIRQESGQAPDLVISADTVVIFPSESQAEASTQVADHGIPTIFEKPESKSQQLECLELLNGNLCEVATGVTIVIPATGEKGYRVLTLSSVSQLQLVDSPPEVLEAYVKSGEGLTKAAGFGVRGSGSILVEKTFGDYHNCIGFPTGKFWRWMNRLATEGVFQENA